MPYRTMGVLPSTQPVVTFGSSVNNFVFLWHCLHVLCICWLVLLRGGAGGGGMLILVLCCVTLCYVNCGVGVGAGVIRISGCRFIAFLARCVSKDIKMWGLFDHTIPLRWVVYVYGSMRRF